MCGIVGLHAKVAEFEPEAGDLLVTMAEALAERGPDSAGFAVYDRDPVARASLLAGGRPVPWEALAEAAGLWLGVPVRVRAAGDIAEVRAEVAVSALVEAIDPARYGATLIGCGRSMTVAKGLGSPRALADRFEFAARAVYQGLGHTRMATESAVTVAHSHPFATGPDLALVHNGSFSNHATIRRRLQDRGVDCDTDNDSEVAARYVGYRLALGDDLAEALRYVVKEFDGFFTLLVTTATEFAVVRDAYACKPAVVAETDQYVAVASEYRALAGLPGIDQARVSEPAPTEVYVWTR
jgi:glutamate synthase domain-containing protein 1